MTPFAVFLLIITLICLPFFIIYRSYIRRGTGIKWYEDYFLCPECQFKIGENMYYKTETLNEWYTYETKYGKPDLRYKDNPLCREIKYYYKCKNCNKELNEIITDYNVDDN